MKKKVAILYKGISSTTGVEKDNLPQQIDGHGKLKPYVKLEFDFLNTSRNTNHVLNYIEFVKQPLEAAGYEIEVYLATYNSPSFKKICQVLKPKKYVLGDIAKDHQHDIFLKGLELVDDCEFVVTLRFDGMFATKLTDMNYNVDKVNFLWREGNGAWIDGNQIGDLMFLHSYKYNDIFIQTLAEFKKHDGPSMHYTYRTMIPLLPDGEGDTNFMVEGQSWSCKPNLKNPYYNIHRNIQK